MKALERKEAQRVFKELPARQLCEVLDTLKRYSKVDVWFYDGDYHVCIGSWISSSYPDDQQFVGTVTADEVYTDEEKILNYVESFHSFPVEYKGEKDYKMLKAIEYDWTARFRMVNGNIVRA